MGLTPLSLNKDFQLEFSNVEHFRNTKGPFED